MTTTRFTTELQRLYNAHPAIAATGRIKSFLFYPERKTLAPSCMLRVFKGDLKAELPALSWYLQTNAGIKIHLHETCLNNWQPCKFKWFFDIKQSHPDMGKMDAEAATRKWDGQEIDHLIIVEDTMDSIRESWVEFIDAVLSGGTILVDLSDIRAAGKSSETGIVSTGVFGLEDSDEGFLSVYKWLADFLTKPCIENLLVLFGGMCRVIARGGTHKNGIVTTSVNYNAPFIWDYLEFPLSAIPGGSKKSVRFDEKVLEDEALCERIMQGVNEESVFLEKIDSNNVDIYANVCMGLWIAHSGSCLTAPFNIAQCATPEDIPKALCAMTKFMCELHVSWRKLAHNYKPELYLDIDKDRQVGITVMGLASFLAVQKVTYKELTEGLKDIRTGAIEYGIKIKGKWDLLETHSNKKPNLSHKIAHYLYFGYHESTKIARSYNLERAFGIEPNQRCYLDYKDLQGYTVTRQIDPPFSNPESRESAVHGEDIIQYHPLVETAEEVEQEVHQQVHEEWQLMMESTGLAHGTSFDLYEYVDLDWFKDFVKRSPLRGTYYQQANKLDQSYLDKGSLCTIDDPDCVSCGS